jgi:hypothetical protein
MPRKIHDSLPARPQPTPGSRINGWIRKFHEALKNPVNASTEADRGRLIALDHVANELLAQQEVSNGGLSTHVNRGRRARDLLESIVWNTGSVFWLLRAVKTVRAGLRRTNAEEARHVAPLVGKPLIDEKLFEHRPDPIREPGFRPEADARFRFVAGLILSYRCAGGTAYIHKDGRDSEPTPFMSFLTTVCRIIPQPKPTCLHSATRSALRKEKLGGVDYLPDVIQRAA